VVIRPDTGDGKWVESGWTEGKYERGKKMKPQYSKPKILLWFKYLNSPEMGHTLMVCSFLDSMEEYFCFPTVEEYYAT